MGESLLQPDHLDHLLEPIAVNRLLRNLQRQQDVLFSAERGYQIERLEDESYLRTSQVGELLLAHRRHFEAFDKHLAGSRLVESRHAMHQRGLA